MGIGVVLRDNAGTFLGAVAATIGHSTSTTTKLLAIKQGLKLRIPLHDITSIHIETDSLVVFHILVLMQVPLSQHAPSFSPLAYLGED